LIATTIRAMPEAQNWASGSEAPKSLASELGNLVRLTLVIAALNEEAGIGYTLSEIKEVLEDPFFLVVDGNSSDGTAKVAKDHAAEVMVQDGVKGKGAAISQGLKYLGKLGVNTDYIVLTDADYTYPAEHIPSMVEILERDETVGMVIGDRFEKGFNIRSAMTDRFYFGNRVLALMQSLLNGVKLYDPLSGLRVVRWNLIEDWKPKSKGFDIEAELNYYVEKMGYRTVEIPIQYRPRLGDKKLKIKHGFTILRRIMSQSVIS
jgi:glycosyltransferase involved in cell wall biosynthesis